MNSIGNIKRICSFDPGVVNFSFLIEEYDMLLVKNIKCPLKKFVKKEVNPQQNVKTKKKRGADLEISMEYNEFLEQFYHCSKTIIYKNTDVSCDNKITSNKCLTSDIFIKLTQLLDSYKEYLEKCDEIVIEEQMSFAKRINLTAIKIGQHVYSYFSIKYPSKKITILPAYNKTQLLGCPGGFTKPQRKKWIVEKGKEIWTLRGDLENLEKIEKTKGKKAVKLDDVFDCLALNLTYMITDNYN